MLLVLNLDEGKEVLLPVEPETTNSVKIEAEPEVKPEPEQELNPEPEIPIKKGNYNLDYLDDPNFDPFATKTKVENKFDQKIESAPDTAEQMKQTTDRPDAIKVIPPSHTQPEPELPKPELETKSESDQTDQDKNSEKRNHQNIRNNINYMI